MDTNMIHKVILEIEAEEYSDTVRALKDCLDSVECFDDTIKATGLILTETGCGYRYKMNWDLVNDSINRTC